jgi:tetratricopeptide (TPR) repeat protein
MNFFSLNRLTFFLATSFASVVWAAGVAAQHDIHQDRLKFWSRVKPLNFGDYLPVPEISLPMVSMKLRDIPKEITSEKEFLEMEKVFELQANEDYEKAYLQADKFLTRNKLSPMAEWMQILKADLFFQVQSARPKKNYNLALEEYQDALRQYPLNPQAPRILYEIGLLQLRMGFFGDVNTVAARGLKEFENSEFAPMYRLLDAEQAFEARDDLKASFDFSMIIQKFPKTRAAVDSAFRKAFILFRRGEFKLAYKVYEELEKYHSDEISRLKLEIEPSSNDKFVDRVYYAETIFLNQKYDEAAKLFQDLANLFPNHPVSPHLFLRLADTYFWRGRAFSAEKLYSEVLTKYSKDPTVSAAAKMRIADLYFLTADIDAAEKNETYYAQAFDEAKKADQSKLAALALARLSAYYIFNVTYPKAQVSLRKYRETFKDTPNQAWVDEEFTKTVELEILEYYHREDYLAALTTYLMFERDQANHFQNTAALLKIADAASRLGLSEKASQILNRVVYLEKSQEGRQEALLRLVDILIQDGEYRKASERLRRFSFAYPSTPLMHLYEMHWGNLYTALKNHEQATKHYEKALEAAKADPQKLFDLRYVFMRLAEEYQKTALPLRAVEAYDQFSRIVAEVKDNPLSQLHLTKKDYFLFKFSKYRIADIHFQMHDFVKALESYRIVVKEVKDEPFFSHASYRIGECYLALEDRKAALAAFQAIPASDPKNIWAMAAKSYIASVQMEVKYGIRIFN